MYIVILVICNVLSCQISLVSEERISKFGKQFAVGRTHPCRVVQFNYIDNAVIVSLQKYVHVYCAMLE